MIIFLRRLWAFVRPYRSRFILGLLCGIGYGLANGALAGVIKTVVDLVFTGSTNLHAQLENAPVLLRPLSSWVASWLPAWTAPTTTGGWVLLVGLIPAVMLGRVVLAYLSIYLTNWAAMRAIADIRTKLFVHLQDLPLSFFSRASTGDLIARITNDTQVLYRIIGSSFASMVKDPRDHTWTGSDAWPHWKTLYGGG